MRTTRLLFDDSEAAESIARRIVRAFNPGEFFCVKGKFFRVSNLRTANETSRLNIEGDKYTLILNVGEPVIDSQPVSTVPISDPSSQSGSISDSPPSEIVSIPPKRVTSKSGEYEIVRKDASKVTREGPPKILPVAGQRWRTKDIRRVDSPSFTVLKVDNEFAYTDKGGRISLRRWRNYRLVEDDVITNQFSG